MNRKLILVFFCMIAGIIQAGGEVISSETPTGLEALTRACAACVQQCPRINCPQPCPPCNPCIPTDIISGCFFAGGSPTVPVLSQMGQRFVVTFDPVTDVYTISLVSPSCSLIVPIVASSGTPQPVLVPPTSNNSFSITGVMAGQLVCFLAASLT